MTTMNWFLVVVFGSRPKMSMEANFESPLAGNS